MEQNINSVTMAKFYIIKELDCHIKTLNDVGDVGEMLKWLNKITDIKDKTRAVLRAGELYNTALSDGVKPIE